MLKRLRRTSVVLVVATAPFGIGATGCTTVGAGVPDASEKPFVEPTYDYLEPDGSARAVLDEATEQIHLPLEAYYMSDRETVMVDHVFHLQMDECLRESGRSYAQAQADWRGAVEQPDRTRGIWSTTNAARYGYELLPSAYVASAQGILAAEGTKDEATLAAEQACDDSIERIPGLSYGSGYQGPDTAFMQVADAGVAFAALEAASSELEAQLRTELDACYTENGLVIRADRAWGAAIPADQERAVKQAVLDAQCHRSTGITQQLADLEAQFQAAYIAEHESELVAVKEKRDAFLEQARDYIASHG